MVLSFAEVRLGVCNVCKHSNSRDEMSRGVCLKGICQVDSTMTLNLAPGVLVIVLCANAL